MPANIPHHALYPSNNNVLPLKSALQPYQPPQSTNQSGYNFNILQLLSDVTESDEDLILAATQMEAQLSENSTNVTKTSMFAKKSSPKENQMAMFQNCKFGNIGTLNIHIHKN